MRYGLAVLAIGIGIVIGFMTFQFRHMRVEGNKETRTHYDCYKGGVHTYSGYDISMMDSPACR